jgi:hypothetical protein
MLTQEIRDSSALAPIPDFPEEVPMNRENYEVSDSFALDFTRALCPVGCEIFCTFVKQSLFDDSHSFYLSNHRIAFILFLTTSPPRRRVPWSPTLSRKRNVHRITKAIHAD